MTSLSDVSFDDFKKKCKELTSENISVKTALKNKNKEIEELKKSNELLRQQNVDLIKKQQEINNSNFFPVPLEEYYHLTTSNKLYSKIYLLDQGPDFIVYTRPSDNRNHILAKRLINTLIDVRKDL